MIKVLLVDDEPGNVESLRAVMESEANYPIEFFTANNEDSAKDIILQKQIDVVVTDLIMTTEQGGLEVLRAAKEKDPLIMVVLLTAFEQRLDRYKAFDLGAFDVVPKNGVGVNPGREILVKVKGASEFRKLAIKQIELEKTRNSLSRYFDPKIFDLLESQQNILDLKDQMVTIAFWDIRGFSALSESLKAHPTLIAGFLEDYFDLMSRVIFQNNGVLDKFIGDGTMAIFGAMTSQSNEETIKIDAGNAILTALEIMPQFEELVQKWRQQWGLYTPQQVEIGLGCGIHTGGALVGKIGTTVRDQFTALGPNVNLTARLCSRALPGQILTTTGTQLRCREAFNFQDEGTIDNIKNIPGSYPVYNVISMVTVAK